jgi:hypothetical protein
MWAAAPVGDNLWVSSNGKTKPFHWAPIKVLL